MNKNLKYITLVLLVILVALPYLGRTARAQGTVDSFENEIVKAREGKVESVETRLLIAGGEVIKYIDYCILAIQQGQTAALDQFNIWYRKRKNAEGLASKGVAEELLNFVYKLVVKKVFPEATPLEELFKTATKNVLDATVSELSPSGGDVNLFLDELQAVKNKYNAEIAKIPREFPNKYPAAFLSAKWEYYMYSSKNNPHALPAETKKYLSTVGISEPTDTFRKELLENIFASYIERIMRSEERLYKDSFVADYPAAAMAEALWVLDPVKNKQRICELQRKGIYAIAWKFRDCNG
jgi:hypothetical protein